ncbi:MAG: TlpA family protein disulfide reductase [Eubacteriales bacterium]
MRKIIASVLAVLMLLPLCACAPTGGEAELQPAPDFTVYNEDGEPVMLSDMRGKPVVLNFWASWCAPCKKEMPEFDKVCGEFEGRVEFMMVNLTDGIQEKKEEALGFVRAEGYTFSVYLDLSGDAAEKYGVVSIPTTFFIDAEGYVIANATGRIDEDTLKRGISMIYTEINDK